MADPAAALVKALTGGSVSQVAVLYGATAIIFVIMQFVFSPIKGTLSDRFGRKPVMLVALTTLGFDNILLASNKSNLPGFLGTIPHVLGWALASTAITTLASKRVDASSQGYMQGASGGITGFAAIIGPLMATSSFAWFTSINSPVNFPGAFFIFGAGLLATSAIMATKLHQIES